MITALNLRMTCFFLQHFITTAIWQHVGPVCRIQQIANVLSYQHRCVIFSKSSLRGCKLVHMFHEQKEREKEENPTYNR